MSLFVFEYPCLVRAICNYWNDLSERRAFQPRGGHFSLMSIMPGGHFCLGWNARGTFRLGWSARGGKILGGHFSPLHRYLDCFWIQRGDGSPQELQGFAKTWRTKYGAVQRGKRAISCGIFSHFFHTIRHVYRLASLALVPRTYVLRMIVKLA